MRPDSSCLLGKKIEAHFFMIAVPATVSFHAE